MGRVLVTGAAGFLGSHLVDRLVADGHAVIGIDDYSTGDAGHLAGVVDQMEALINLPVCGALSRSIPGGPFDTLYHFAGHVGVGHILGDPLRMLSDHVEDIHAVCEAAFDWNATVVITSTSEVYGDSPDVPYREDAVLHVGPSQELRSGYAVSKLYAEHYALAMHRQHRVKAIVARLFNVAGPRQRAEGGCVVPRFVTAALRGEPLTVHGNGSQQRCFSHVSDVVTALVKLADTPAAVGQIVNVGQPEPITILQAARDILYAADPHDAGSPIHCVPFADLDTDAGWSRMHWRQPDATKLEQLTGYRIPNRWPDIVSDTVAYWRERIAREEKAA